jgi:hypothetical protein
VATTARRPRTELEKAGSQVTSSPPFLAHVRSREPLQDEGRFTYFVLGPDCCQGRNAPQMSHSYGLSADHPDGWAVLPYGLRAKASDCNPTICFGTPQGGLKF